jgi:Mrp family chromosome partitioning ATPase
MVVRAKLRLPTLESIGFLSERLGLGSAETAVKVAEEPKASLLRLAHQLDMEMEAPAAESLSHAAEPPPLPGHVHPHVHPIDKPRTSSGLQGCRVAAIGFGRQDIGSLAACMQEQRAGIEFLPRGEHQFAKFDLLILNSGPVLTFKREVASFRAALESGVPSIVTGSRPILAPLREIGGQHIWDFVPKPFSMDELVWRAVNLLKRSKETARSQPPARIEIPAESPVDLACAAECEPPTADGPFKVLDPSCSSEYLEQFRFLRTRLMLHRARFEQGQDFQVVCVMSANKGEGKTFTASNLAAMLAVTSGERVLFIDSDPESAPLPIGMPIVEKAGLSYALSKPGDWARTAQRVKGTSLYVMTRDTSTLSRNLDFGPLPRLLDLLRQQFEWIVVDGAAFASCPDARWLTAVSDGTLLVVRESASSFSAVKESIASVPPDRFVGVVFNQWQE